MIGAAAFVLLAVSAIIALWVHVSRLPDEDLALLETLALWGGQY